MPETRMKKETIEAIRKRLDALMKGKRPYEARTFDNHEFDREAGRLCRLLIGSGIYNERAKVPKPMRALRGHGRVRIITRGERGET